jgi:hypothetical protein
MNLKDEINNLTNKEKMLVAVLVGLTIINLIFLITSKGNIKYFWFIDYRSSIYDDYDFTEFIIYGILPWLVFIVYKYLKKNKI